MTTKKQRSWDLVQTQIFFKVSFNTLKYPFNNIVIKYMGSKAVGGHERRVLYFLMEIESHVTEWKKSSV